MDIKRLYKEPEADGIPEKSPRGKSPKMGRCKVDLGAFRRMLPAPVSMEYIQNFINACKKAPQKEGLFWLSKPVLP